MQVQVLDEVAEGRANALEFVSERLSRHVLANYDMFLKGINEAASVETDLQVRSYTDRQQITCCTLVLNLVD